MLPEWQLGSGTPLPLRRPDGLRRRRRQEPALPGVGVVAEEAPPEAEVQSEDGEYIWIISLDVN